MSTNATANTFHSDGLDGSANGGHSDGGAETNDGNDENESVISDGCVSTGCKQCCGCLDGTVLLLPWKNNSCEKNAFELATQRRGNGDVTLSERKTNGIPNVNRLGMYNCYNIRDNNVL